MNPNLSRQEVSNYIYLIGCLGHPYNQDRTRSHSVISAFEQLVSRLSSANQAASTGLADPASQASQTTMPPHSSTHPASTIFPNSSMPHSTTMYKKRSMPRHSWVSPNSQARQKTWMPLDCFDSPTSSVAPELLDVARCYESSVAPGPLNASERFDIRAP